MMAKGVTNPAIANLIREDKVHQVYSQMQLNQAGTGMVTQTQQLAEFVQKRLVTKNMAMAYSNRPDELARILGMAAPS